MKHSQFTTAAILAGAFCSLNSFAADRPNVILIMADDLGWGDTGYNGNTIIKTPHLDQMTRDGLRFDRFYSASAVCSPTRASCLTGRNPQRMGIFNANNGILRPEEISLPEILKEQGYATGHFGKWHLGTLTTKEKDANRGEPGNTKEFNPPKLHGYDQAFVTESKVPTYDPMKKPKDFGEGSLKRGWSYIEEGQEWVDYGTSYWDIDGQKVTGNLDGDDSRVIMDRVIPFVKKAVDSNQPFLSVIWFHTPHLPCVAGPKHQEMYKDQNYNMRNYAGCITAMDEQIGRLRTELKQMGADQNTMIWFCSDNGPEMSKYDGGNGLAGEYRGRKRDLYDGGVRVPGVMVWPAQVAPGSVTDKPCVTSDYVPTVIDALGIHHPQPGYALDGVSLMPLLKSTSLKREPIGFILGKKLSYNGEKYKLVSYDAGKSFSLFDMVNDPYEKNDLYAAKPEIAADLIKKYKAWEASARESFEGKEYGRESFDRLGQNWNVGTSATASKKGSKKKRKKK